jgi:hypothetical protein
MTDTDKERDDFLAWWTSIQTDARKYLLRGAHDEPERLHALLRTAFEACCTKLDAIPAKPEPVGWVDDGGLVFWRDGKPPKDGSDLFAGGAAVTDEAKDAAR